MGTGIQNQMAEVLRKLKTVTPANMPVPCTTVLW